MSLFSIGFLVAIIAPAHGSHIYCDGPVTYSKVISSKISILSNECKVKDALKLVHGPKQFSFGVYSVTYWQGSYKRSAVQTNVVRYDTYTCLGVKIDSETVKYETPIDIKFSLENTNLKPSVTSWIEATAPMTDEEAVTAMQAAEKRCLDSI